MKKYILDLQVVKNTRQTQDFVVLELTSSKPLPPMVPGQFVEVRVDHSKTTFLRRPISIHDVDYKTNKMWLLIQEVGDGSQAMAAAQPGETMNLVMPLGNTFSLPESQDENILLVGGGCGVAPLLFLGRTLHEKGFKPKFLLGARTQEQLVEVEAYKQFGEVYITTEDGSVGEKGFVIHHSILWNEAQPIDRIYTCGPDLMMQAVGKYAHKRDISCEVSLENTMACGIGACLCCVTETKEGHKCVCTDGPVFNINDLKWQF